MEKLRKHSRVTLFRSLMSSNKPVRFCVNVKLCPFGVCNGCYNVKLTEDVAKPRDGDSVCDEKDGAAVL